jgi:MYXO-CTERM domain-containing protein
VPNPGTPGSGHHGGFHCDPDPNASHCSAAPGRGDLAWVGLVGVAALAALARRG